MGQAQCHGGVPQWLARRARTAAWRATLRCFTPFRTVQAAPGGAVVTIYVKRADVAGARYAAVSGVAAEQTVDELTACWMKQAKLRDVDPSLVTLHRVACSLHKPPPLAEADAKALDDPSLTLVEAGLASTAWLLATVAQAPLPGACACPVTCVWCLTARALQASRPSKLSCALCGCKRKALLPSWTRCGIASRTCCR